MLARFVHDFEQFLARGPAPSPSVARCYERGGTGARDPRTGAALARYRDALRGRLDPMLEAYRSLPTRPVVEAHRDRDAESHRDVPADTAPHTQ